MRACSVQLVKTPREGLQKHLTGRVAPRCTAAAPSAPARSPPASPTHLPAQPRADISATRSCTTAGSCCQPSRDSFRYRQLQQRLSGWMAHRLCCAANTHYASQDLRGGPHACFLLKAFCATWGGTLQVPQLRRQLPGHSSWPCMYLGFLSHSPCRTATAMIHSCTYYPAHQQYGASGLRQPCIGTKRGTRAPHMLAPAYARAQWRTHLAQLGQLGWWSRQDSALSGPSAPSDSSRRALSAPAL